MSWRVHARRLAQIIVPGAVLPLFLSACGQLLFFAANVPTFGQPRQTNLRYMDGPRGQLDFYPALKKPAGKSTAQAAPSPPPLIVFWYGGGFEDGSKSSYRFVGSALAKLGYPVIIPDYRLYPARFPAYVEDGARAIAWAQQHASELGADPHRIVLAGHSAGAYIAAMLAVNPDYVRAAGGDPAGIAGLIGLSGPYAIKPTEPPLTIAFSAPYTPEQWQATRFAGAGDPPALLVHGLDDDRVAPSHTQRLADALAAGGVSAKLLLYPKHGHADTVAALSVPARGRLPVLAEIDAFLKQGIR